MNFKELKEEMITYKKTDIFDNQKKQTELE